MRKNQLNNHYANNDRSMPNGDPRDFRAFPAGSLPRLRFGRRVACKVLIKNDFSMKGEPQKKFYPEFPYAAGKGRGGPTRLERADGLRNREPAICHASADCKKRRRLVAPVCQEHLQTSLVSGSSRSEFPCPSVISSAESGQTASRRSMAAASMFSGSRRLVPDLRPLTCHMPPPYRLGIFGGN
jgi:hypothetical protein